MKFLGIKILVVVSGALLCSTRTIAQDRVNPLWNTLEQEERTSSWLTSSNVAGLLHFKQEKLSFVEANFNKGNGEFINYYQSNDNYNFGVNSRSLYRVNSKTVLRGGISYHNGMMQNATGSVLINPFYAPFDIVEPNGDYAGDKLLEEYRLSAALATQLSDRLAIGGEVRYGAANYSKRRDIRHYNTLSDIDVNVSLCYKLSKRAELGVLYNYRKVIENIGFGRYGDSATDYEFLVSYGGFWGTREVFGSGTLVSSSSRPIVDKYNGGGLQFSYDINKALTLYAEGQFTLRNGFYGVESPSSVVYLEHNSSIIDFKTTLQYRRAQTAHALTIWGRQEQLVNNKNIYREVSDNGLSYIEYFDPVKVGDKAITEMGASYIFDYYSSKVKDASTYTVTIDGGLLMRNTTAIIYPYYRKQDITQLSAAIAVKRNFELGPSSLLTTSLGVKYQSGSGTPFTDGSYATSSGESTYVFSNELLNIEYEYLTTPQLNVTPSVRYSKLFKGTVGYLEVGAMVDYATKVVYLPSNSYTSIKLSLGYIF